MLETTQLTCLVPYWSPNKTTTAMGSRPPSCCGGGQLDDRIIAQRRDCFQAHVAAANRPFIVLFEQQRANEARDCIFVWENADDMGAPLDLTIEPFGRINNRYEMRGADDRLRCSSSWRVRPSGRRHREHEGAGRPIHTMSRELELLAGRLCDSPGCAESANP